MNDHTYDISYLLDADQLKADAPELRMAKAAPTRSTPSAASLQSAVAAAQEAMARELLVSAEAHEELIQQYLRFSSDSLQGPYGK